MIIKNKESWGEIMYRLPEHVFEYKSNKTVDEIPYLSKPVLLNIDLTFQCNMKCKHCVAKDLAKILGGVENGDLEISDKLIKRINKSPFMVIVITGGEPLLPQYRDNLAKLLNGLRNKGVIVDTNGTIMPDQRIINLLKRKQVMLRVSWDIPIPDVECKLRCYGSGMYKNPTEYMNAKEKIIKYLIKQKLAIAVQTVLTKENYTNNNLYQFPKKLSQLGIKQWYIQRFIPSHLVKRNKNFLLESKEYEWALNKIFKIANLEGIDCITKLDRRHNSVFLLVKDGDLYTQSDQKPGEKILLGKIGEVRDYFDYVSHSEHTNRYCQKLKRAV